MVSYDTKQHSFLRRFILLTGILACLALFATTWTITTAQSNEPQRTATPPAQSLTPDLAETATTEHLLSIDPLYVTATAFILQATETASSAQKRIDGETATTEFLLNIDPLYVTATAFILQVTQTAAQQRNVTPPPVTYSPIPTLTAKQIDDLYSQWKTPLETTAGFSHPIFDYIAYGWALEMSRRIIYANLPESTATPIEELQVNLETRETEFNGDSYLAMIIHGLDYYNYQLLIFQLHDSVPTLVPDGEFYGSFYFGSGENSGFADRNNNGLPELLVGISPGPAQCNRPTLALLEIHPDGQITSITPHLESHDMFLNDLVDVNNDGTLEIEALLWLNNPYPVGGCNPLVTNLWYGWDGTAYTNISGELGESYYPDIQAYWESMADKDGCLLPDYEMYQMLVSYIAMGRLHEGWARLGPLLQWEKCSPETLIEQAEEFGQFLSWIGTELHNEQQTQQ